MDKKKYIIFGLDNSGKTSLAKLMSLFSYGELKFSDTSELLFSNPAIPEELREAAKQWQENRKNSCFSKEQQEGFRENLKQVYSQYAFECLSFALQRSDIYAGLRDKKIVNSWSTSENYGNDYIFIHLRSSFRLACLAETEEERLSVFRQEADYETWPCFYDVENEKSFFDFLYNSWSFVQYLKEKGFWRENLSLERKFLCWISWPFEIGLIYYGL